MLRGFSKLTRKLKGYKTLGKDRHLTCHMLGLTDSEFRLFELYQDVYDWDSRHYEEYGTVSFPDRVIAKLLGWNASKVCRIRNKLIGKKLLTHISRGIYAINPIFEYKSKLADMKQIIADTQQENSLVDQDVPSMQQKQTQKDKESLLSFKGNIVSSPNDDNDIPF